MASTGLGRATKRISSSASGGRAAAILLTLLAAAHLGGCGKRVESGPGQVLHLEPRAIRPLPEVPGPIDREIAIPSELSAWEVTANRAEIVEVPAEGEQAARRFLELGGVPDKHVRIPGPFEPGSFNRVVLGLRVFGQTEVLAQGLSAGRVGPTSEGAWLSYGRELQAVVLELPHLRTVAEPLDALEIVVRGPGIAQLERVTLVKRSFEHWLPRADEEPALVPIAGEARRVRALSSAVPWEAGVEVPGGSSLSFSYGVPPLLAHPAPEPVVLRVRVEARGASPLEERFPLPIQGRSQGWERAAIDLDRFAGKHATLRFELASPDGELALCALGEVRVARPGSEAPLVLLVTSDTHRADYLGLSHAGVEVRTPHIDALAQRGVVFEDCFSSTNSTNPSHVALMTGKHPRDTGIVDNNSPLSSLAPTLAQRFHEAGFVTFAAVSTRHLGHDVSGLGTGFDRKAWPPFMGEHSSHETVGRALSWLPEVEGLPLFLWVHVFDAHTPYEPPEEFAGLYYDLRKDPFDPGLEPLAGGLEKKLPRYMEGLRDIDWPEAMYRGEVSSLDSELGRLFEQPRVREGVVLFTADHGEVLGQHGIFYSHEDVYPDSIHIPLVLSWPGGPRGLRVKEPVHQLDIGRTLLDLAGLERVPFDGRSLLETISGSAREAPRFSLSANYTSASLTWRGWHLMLHLREHSDRSRLQRPDRHQVQLFHLAEDPGCQLDLVEREPERAKEMRAQLLDWLSNAQRLGWAKEKHRDSALRAELARLGYATDDAASSLEDYIQPECACAWCARFR